MIIHYNPDDYVVESGSKTCAYHKEHPGKNYAGCTCSGWYTTRLKTKEERDG